MKNVKVEDQYKKLLKEIRSKTLFSSLAQHEEWDQETYMPEEGIGLKVEINELLQLQMHKIMTSKRYEKHLNLLIDLKSGKVHEHLSSELQASLREMRRDFLHTKKLTPTFLKKFSEATTHALDAWKKAKKESAFKIFLPHLKRLVDLSKKKADLLGYQDHPYDALLDLYEPENTTKKTDVLFSTLKEKTLSLLSRIQKQGKFTHDLKLEGPFARKDQEILCKDVIERIGIPQGIYNLSETAHPFCFGLYPKDIRLTTKYHEDSFLKAFSSSIHEAGHGLYESNLPLEHFGSPLGEPASFGIHESQSRIWETCIGHSRAFLSFYMKEFKRLFPSLQTLSLDDLYTLVNRVSPSLIRIYADEVTYNLHIILRYEIEKGFLDGSIAIKDLPDVWNQKMLEMFGIKPKNDTEGCLQDVHWSLGYFGYFPSYTMGNLYAGALFVRIIKNHPDWEKNLSQGNFSFMAIALKDMIHKWGRQYAPQELIEKATGTPFTIEPYFNYLSNKYLS